MVGHAPHAANRPRAAADVETTTPTPVAIFTALSSPAKLTATGHTAFRQPRYWEHTLEDEDDFERHFDYIHWNPVKHGYVQCPREWPHSSFHRYVRLGVYEPDWGSFAADKPLLDFGDMEDTAGEP